MMHIRDMVVHGAKSVLVRCSDTDVLVLGISFFHSFQSRGLEELWFLFGVGTQQRYIPAHSIAINLGSLKAVALRGFHAFTGCDTVSFFASKGKLTAWNAWSKLDVATNAFKRLAEPQVELDDDVVKTLQNFTILMYNSKSMQTNVNKTRENLFCSEGRPVCTIPPTAASLFQQMKRAAYQAGHIWGCTDDFNQNSPPSPSQWGWIDNGSGWTPFWNDLPEIWSALRELQNCGCKQNCENQRCSCRRLQLPCTPACKHCKGDCKNSRYGMMYNKVTVSLFL